MHVLTLAAALLLAFGTGGAQPYGSSPPFPAPSAAPGQLPRETIHYGDNPEQRLFLTVPPGEGPHPIVVWVAGADFTRGAESLSTMWIPELLFDHGFAMAGVHTRKDHEVGAAGVAEDNAAAVGALVREAARYGLDPERIVLLGVGAQGHFATLLATDPELLESAGVPFGAVRAAVGFNAEGFDVPARLTEGNRFRAHFYRKMFGDDPAAQRRLSPAAHLDTPNAPSFLFAVTEGQRPFTEQARTMAAALERTGAQAAVWPLQRSVAGREATYIGTPQHPRTQDLVAFLRRAFAAPVE